MAKELTALDKQIRALNARYKAHCERGDGIFRGRRSQLEIRGGTIDYFHETDPETGQLNSSGYIVAPPRLGKTIIIGDYILGINTTLRGNDVLGVKASQKRALICVPTNQLVEQWEDRLLGETDEKTGKRKPGIFKDRIHPEHVGVLRAGMSYTERDEALSRPIVLGTNDLIHSYATHTDKAGKPAPLLRAEDFSVVAFDELDHQWRGDMHREFFKEHFLGKTQVIGMTATPLFRDGKTVGDYLFSGKTPVCEITHKEAIDRGEIAPNVTITYEPRVDRLESDIRVASNHWEMLTDKQKEKFIEQTGSDDAAVEIMKAGSHPRTGRKLSEMKQLWKGETISHSQLFADKLNVAFGKGYAAVVYGTQDEGERRAILDKYKRGEIKALVQCKYLGRGFDDADVEFTGQLGPSQSPNDLIQFYTRADTRKADKIALHLTPRFEGIQQLHVGELLGGQVMIPPGYQYPPTVDKAKAEAGEVTPWPDIKGVKVYYTTEQTEQLASKLRRERLVQGLPRKKEGEEFTLEEMATRLNVTPAILQERVYVPLQEAYDKREERTKTVEVPRTDNDVIYLNGMRFPVSSVGYRRDNGGQERFCVDKLRGVICERALYGALNRAATRPELLSRDMAARRLDTTDVHMDTLWEDLQQAALNRAAYARSTHLGGVEFLYNDFGYYRNAEGKPELFITADALKAAHKFCNPDDNQKTEHWAASAKFKPLKTSEWLTAREIFEELSLYGQEAGIVQAMFNNVKVRAKTLRAGEENTLPADGARHAHRLRIAMKYLPLAGQMEQNQLCFHRDEIEWVKDQLGIENTFIPPKRGAVKI